jgi:hypothetical protein
MRYGNYWQFKRFTLVIGFSIKRFGLGFSVNQWGADLDLGFFWIGVEW